jgi:hypothetical protein
VLTTLDQRVFLQPGSFLVIQDAVQTLNTLQSNAVTLEKIKAERDKKRHLSLPETIAHAERIGITVSGQNTLTSLLNFVVPAAAG